MDTEAFTEINPPAVFSPAVKRGEGYILDTDHQWPNKNSTQAQDINYTV